MYICINIYTYTHVYVYVYVYIYMYILFLFFNRASNLFSEEPVEMHTQIHTQSLRNTHTKEPSNAHAHT